MILDLRGTSGYLYPVRGGRRELPRRLLHDVFAHAHEDPNAVPFATLLSVLQVPQGFDAAGTFFQILKPIIQDADYGDETTTVLVRDVTGSPPVSPVYLQGFLRALIRCTSRPCQVLVSDIDVIEFQETKPACVPNGSIQVGSARFHFQPVDIGGRRVWRTRVDAKRSLGAKFVSTFGCGEFTHDLRIPAVDHLDVWVVESSVDSRLIFEVYESIGGALTATFSAHELPMKIAESGPRLQMPHSTTILLRGPTRRSAFDPIQQEMLAVGYTDQELGQLVSRVPIPVGAELQVSPLSVSATEHARIVRFNCRPYNYPGATEVNLAPLAPQLEIAIPWVAIESEALTTTTTTTDSKLTIRNLNSSESLELRFDADRGVAINADIVVLAPRETASIGVHGRLIGNWEVRVRWTERGVKQEGIARICVQQREGVKLHRRTGSTRDFQSEAIHIDGIEGEISVLDSPFDVSDGDAQIIFPDGLEPIELAGLTRHGDHIVVISWRCTDPLGSYSRAVLRFTQDSCDTIICPVGVQMDQMPLFTLFERWSAGIPKANSARTLIVVGYSHEVGDLMIRWGKEHFSQVKQRFDRLPGLQLIRAIGVVTPSSRIECNVTGDWQELSNPYRLELATGTWRATLDTSCVITEGRIVNRSDRDIWVRLVVDGESLVRREIPSLTEFDFAGTEMPKGPIRSKVQAQLEVIDSTDRAIESHVLFIQNTQRATTPFRHRPSSTKWIVLGVILILGFAVAGAIYDIMT